MTSRETILNRLRAATVTFDHIPEITTRVPGVLVDADSPQDMLDLFVKQAQALQCTVVVCADEDAAIRHVVETVQPDASVMTWDFAEIPLAGLASALEQAQINAVPGGDPAIRVGVTGAAAALVATGSLVIAAGPGRPRKVSLLPDIHIAVIRQSQLVATLETWRADLLSAGPAAMSAISNFVIVSGPSRTADIAMELVLGAHGPREVHVLIVP